jgi:3-oxoacyl-[acyl-carrier protein] reductase
MGVLMTNVCQYTGPGSVPVLLREHRVLYCHDDSFVDPVAARRFESEHPGALALAAQDPKALADELAARSLEVETVVHTNVHPNTPLPIEEITMEMLYAAFDALLLFPAQLTQCLLPAMKAAGRGRFVFVTSARYLQPEPGFAVATSIRVATTGSLWRWRAKPPHTASR